MKILLSLPTLVLLLAGVICQESTVPTETTPTVTDTTTLETTTIADITTNSDTTPTVSPTTSEVPTTASSTQPPTTTQKTTSTSTPTVPTTTPSSTTPGPTPSTAKPPVAELGSWKVTQNNVTCIRADLKIRFMIPINGREDYITLSPNATSEGSNCNATNGTQELRLTDSDYVFLLTFEKDDKNAYLKNISLNYILGGDSETVYNDTSLFKVKVGNSYLCTNTETVPLLNVSMEVFQIHLQSFGSSANGDFGTAEECEADDKVNDIVPIAVGCCLLALVVIVLIGYFVGRRRSRQKGYQSV